MEDNFREYYNVLIRKVGEKYGFISTTLGKTSAWDEGIDNPKDIADLVYEAFLTGAQTSLDLIKIKDAKHLEIELRNLQGDK